MIKQTRIYQATIILTFERPFHLSPLVLRNMGVLRYLQQVQVVCLEKWMPARIGQMEQWGYKLMTAEKEPLK